MGQAESSAPEGPTDTDAVLGLKDFCTLSKTHVGIHAFQFDKPGDTLVITSEVTDDNNVLDVQYRQWVKNVNDWVPVHTFGNGRVVALAVYNLLRSGYTMKQKKQ